MDEGEEKEVGKKRESAMDRMIRAGAKIGKVDAEDQKLVAKKDKLLTVAEATTKEKDGERERGRGRLCDGVTVGGKNHRLIHG